MGLTIAEKILTKSSGQSNVKAGDFLWCKVDVLMANDPCAPPVIGIFRKEFGENAKVWDSERFVVIPDHFVWSADIQANMNVSFMRKFVDEQGIKNFYDVGSPSYKGVSHIALAEGGHTRPSEVLLGTDSHTVNAGAFGTFAIGVGSTDAAFALGTGLAFLKVPQTIKVDFIGKMPIGVQAKDLILKLIGEIGIDGATYEAIEFSGEVIESLSIDERMTICNMVVECGGKSALMVPNQETLDYVSERTNIPFVVTHPDSDAEYLREITIDVSSMTPVVACPNSPDNVKLLSEVASTRIDRAYIGSCTGGKLTDFIAAATVLLGKKVKIPTYAVPATKEILNGIIKTKIDGLSVYEILVDSGVNLSTEAGCAACCGGPIDTFGRVSEAERVISTTNRNFVGRMGHKKAEIFLASPFTVASTALNGFICNIYF